MNLTDEQWSIVEPLLPKLPVHRHGGRPQADRRDVLDGILWIMRTGAPWNELPLRFPSRQVCRLCMDEWCESGALCEVLLVLADDLEYRIGARVDDLPLLSPNCARDRASWWWQTILLLRSPDAAMVHELRPDSAAHIPERHGLIQRATNSLGRRRFSPRGSRHQMAESDRMQHNGSRHAVWTQLEHPT